MNEDVLNNIQVAYGWQDVWLTPVTSGLINATWKVKTGSGTYVLQKINTNIFKHPVWIDNNLRLLSEYLHKKTPGYLFTTPVSTKDGMGLVGTGDAFYRVFEWIPYSHTIDVVNNSSQAFEAASQFGKFTCLLEDFDTRKLHITLPDFHNLALRYHQFEKAIGDGNPERIKESAGDIQYLLSQINIVHRYQAFTANAQAKIRVTHHDTKISNVLFDKNNKGLCIIDLDTVMPGYFTSDIGDMFRTYICSVSEEEKDLDRIFVRKEFITAIEQGYLSYMDPYLSSFEKDHFYFSGEILIYMQAIRFLADYLNNDIYYGSSYTGNNLIRARNQSRLLALFQEAV